MEIEGGNVTLHSRSGASGRPVRNPEYSKALNMIVSRLNAAKGALTSALINRKMRAFGRGPDLPAN